jgi:carboxymethylenebutenolidase
MTSHSSGSTAQSHSVARDQITIKASDGAFDAYRATPAADAGTGPAVVVVTSIFGVDEDTKNVCHELASQGCVALAPNFFWRDQDSGVLIEADVQRAIARALRIDFSKSMDDLTRAIAEARQHPRCNGKVAVFGYCFGGPYAWRSACDGLGVDAAVSFHGTYVSKYMKPGDTPTCPVSFHYGEHDDFAPPPELDAVRKVAEATGSEFTVHPGAGHAYMMPSKSHYHEEASRASWNAALRVLAGLRA